MGNEGNFWTKMAESGEILPVIGHNTSVLQRLIMMMDSPVYEFVRTLGAISVNMVFSDKCSDR